MKHAHFSARIVVLIAVALFLMAPAFAQTSTFSVDVSALGYSGGGQTSAGTNVGGAVQITKHGAAGYEQIIVPNLSATYYIGRALYNVPVSTLVGKKISSSFVFNPAVWSVTFSGGAGVLRQTLNGVMAQHIATELGASLVYTANSHLGVEVISGQWLHAGVAGPAGNQFIVTPNTAAISSALKITF